MGAVALVFFGACGGFLFNYVFYTKVAVHPVWSQSALVKSLDNRLQVIRQTEKVVVQSNESVADIAQTPAAAVVHVTSADPDGRIVTDGNGIVVGSDGVIATTDGVVGHGATRVYVTFADGTVNKATSMYHDMYSGLVFVRVDAQNLSTIAFANSDDAQSGKRLISIGRDATGSRVSFAAGGMMGAAPEFSVRSPMTDHLQGVLNIDFADTVLAGSVGAPAVDYQGNMVGIIAAKAMPAVDDAPATVRYYAIAANDVYESFAHYLQSGQGSASQSDAAQAKMSDTMMLGMDYAMITPVDAVIKRYNAEHGAVMLAPRTPAARATTTSRGARSGLLPGDIVTAVNDTRVDATDTLSRILRAYKSTDVVTLTVVRGTDTMILPIVK